MERSPRLRAAAEPSGAQVAAGQPLLIVVDYAERWRLPALAELVEALPLDYPERRIRVLLLARPGRGLWQSIAAQLDRSGADLPDPLVLGGFGTDRVALFAVAAAAFAERLARPTPSPPAVAELADTAYGSPLTLHMAALAAVCTEDGQLVGAGSPDGLSRFLLRHERRGWTAIENSPGAPPTDVFEQLVVWGTLLGPFGGQASAVGLLRRARLADGDAQAASLVSHYERLYPIPPSATPASGGDTVLAPLRPDRLGEDLVGLYLVDNPHVAPLLAELLPSPDPSIGINELAIKRCLVVLSA